MILGIITLIASVALSLQAAYVSIIGMKAIFPMGGIEIILIMGFLEFSKLIATVWLHSNWADKTIAKFHKIYLVLAVIILMALTSLGAFGFLSKSHLEQEAPLAQTELQIQQLQLKLDQQRTTNNSLEQRRQQLTDSINSLIGKAQNSREARISERLSRSQKKELDEIQKEISPGNTKLMN